MAVFVTPRPIDAAIDIWSGRIELHASDRDDTVVDVIPVDPRNASHVEAAEATRVDLRAGHLTVTAPKRLARFLVGEGVVVRVLLPAGSRVRADVSFGDITATGRLGSCRLKATSGGVTVDEVAELRVRAANGEVSIRRVDGACDVLSGNSAVRIGRIGGDAVLKGAHGDVEVTELTGRLDAALASGSLHVSRSTGTLVARSGYGGLRIDDLGAGSARLDAVYGGVEVGVRAGVAAWLDLAAEHGAVVNDLGSSAAPADGEPTVDLRARSGWGGIRVTRTIA